MGVINNTPTGKLILTVMLAFAEFERNMILERTQEGRAIARQQPNYKEGRKKKYTPERISAALEMLNTYSYKQVEVRTGISKSTLIRAKREQNYQNAHNII
jgi:DNA invertase Pin-like site-specific DNA recombinase